MKVLSNLSLYGTLGLNSVVDANTDTDKFLVIDSSGIVKYRTGQELYNDIGAGGAASYTSTLQHEVKAGVALTKGQAVYVTSADGTNMIVSKASNASEATSSKTLGLIAQDLSINGKGFVITEGLLSGLNTMAAGTEGDPVWLGTDGNLIYGLGSKPYAPAHLVFIGIVTKRNANNGEIFVKVQNGFELQELHNVQITSTPSDNTVLAYETSTSLYKMKSIPTLLGYTPTTNARTLTINGTSYDLSADRSWSVGTHTGNLTTGYVPKATGATTLTDSLIYDNGSAIGINTNAPYESSAFKLDVDGGVLIKNTKGVAAQLILINSNPATGGNNGFVQLSAGGNTSTAFGQWQTYYGTSIASGALRLQPAGGFVLVGSSTQITGNGLFQVAGDINITGAFRINGVAINTSSMVYPSAGIAVSTGSAWGTSITDNSSNWNTAYGWGNHASVGYLTSSTAASIYLSQVDASNSYLTQSSAASIYLSQVNAANSYLTQSSAASIYLSQVNAANSYLSQSSAASIYLSQVNASNTYLSQSSAASIYASLSGSYSNPSWITSLAWSKITGAPAFITGYTETDTLASVTGRGATTSSPITINGGGTQPLSLSTSSGSPWHIALVRTDLGLTSRVFAHNSPYNGWYFEHNIIIAGNTNWHSGNLTNLNQLSNGPGYITGYTETDTLASVTNRGNTTSQNIIFSNTRKGLVGLYNPAQTQAIFAMGIDYVLTDGGASNNIGNLYGLAWSYNPDYAGAGNNPQSKSGLNHQLLLMQAGVTTAAFGSGMWTSGTITSTNSLGLYVNSGAASYIGINSTSNWSYVSHLNNGTTIWDVGAFNGGQYEIRPYGGGSNRVTVQLNGQFSVNNSQNQVALFQSPNANTWVDIVSSAGTWSMGATGNNRWALYNRGGSEGTRFEVSTANAFVNGNIVLHAANYSSYALPISGGTVTGDVTFGNNSTSDQGIRINYGNYFSGYGRIRFMQDGTNHSTIHSFSASWQSGTLQSSSSGAINLDGQNGVTLGPWNNPSIWVDNGGVAQARSSMRAPEFRFTNSGNSAYMTGDAGWGARIQTDSGYILFGPANASYAHIYTDRGNFYFNKDILINGTQVVVNSGTWGINITGGSGSVSGLTLNNLNSPINPDNVTQNQLGYNTSVNLFGQTDGGLYSSAYSSNWIHQIYGDFRSGQIAIRGKQSGTWQAWRTVLDSGNYTSYALPVNGNWIGNTGMNDQRLFLRTNGDLNHYLWNAADDWEELNAYEGTGFRITSNMGSTGVLYVYGSSNGGYTYSPYSFRAPIFYDSQDTNYYVDPNSESSLYRFTAASMTRNAINYLSINSPFTTRAAQTRPYQNGTMGWGTTDFNTVFSNWGSGFIDSWSSPANSPDNGIATHWVGFQSLHYNHENNTNGYGFQMVYGGGAGHRYFWRNAWASLSGWVEMIHTGNIGSQSVSYANSAGSVSWGNVSGRPTALSQFTNDSGYITSGATVAGLNTTFLGNGSTNIDSGYSRVIRNENSNGGNPTYAPVLHLAASDTMWQISAGHAGQTNLVWRSGYAGTWSTPWWTVWHSGNDGAGSGLDADLLDGYHASNFLGFQGNSYYQVNTWLQMNGTHGIYWPSYYGAHMYVNTTTSYTQFRWDGNKNGYDGVWLSYSAVNGMMYDSGGNGGVYREANGLWYWYYHVGNSCMGVGTSTTSSSYKMYVNGTIYATGDVIAYSDVRKKTNIVTIDNALETVTKMRGVFYDKIGEEEKGRQLGVIAQEVDEVLPEAVSYAKDIDEYGVKYGNLGGLFIEAFKEQQRQIEELKSIIDGLTK
jgi:hypothetical protein